MTSWTTGQAVAKLFFLFSPPFGHDLLREVWRLVEVRAGKIKYERRAYDSHLDNPEFVVVLQQLRYMETAHGEDFMILQTEIDVAFLLIESLITKHLYCGLASC